MTEQQLVAMLESCGLDTTHFGRGNAKTIDDLFQEITSGESTLIQRERRLTRIVRVMCVNVFVRIGGRHLRLIEDRQVFTDGRERRRGLTSVSEKMLPDEDVTAAVYRALAEETGINDFIVANPPRLAQENAEESPSYPGLLTQYTRYEVDVVIAASQYNADGYREVQGNKTTYFLWVEA